MKFYKNNLLFCHNFSLLIFCGFILPLMDESEIISNILKIEKELSAREADPLKSYNADKVHLKQMAFHKCPKRNRWVFGGNRSGKTECGAVEAVYMARGIHPYRPNRKDVFGWVVSVTYEVQRDVAQSKILKYLAPWCIEDIVMLEGRKSSPSYGIIDYIVVKNELGGYSKIGFKSCDQGREKFQGASLDFVWFDEEPPKDIYEECKMRVFDKKGDIFGTMTPLKGLTFIYDEIELNKFNSDEVWCEHIEWKDNPYLDPEEVERMMKNLSDDEQETRRFGHFHTASGLVYSEFDESVHVIDPFDIQREWQSNISIDPGLNNPTSCHFYAVDYDENIYVVAEHYEAGKDVDYHAERIKEIAKRLDWHTDSGGRICALIDSAANQKTLAYSKSVAQLFCERGILVNTKVNKDLFAGIQRIKSLFKNRKLFIFKNCVNLIRELKSYWWGDDDRPKKADDHALDEMRYFVMSLPKPPKREEREKTLIEKDLLRLVRHTKK